MLTCIFIYLFNIHMCLQYIRSGKYTAASDVWSVGCVIMEMATGKPPWLAPKSDVEVRQLIDEVLMQILYMMRYDVLFTRGALIIG